jgi:hypothetical protein
MLRIVQIHHIKLIAMSIPAGGGDGIGEVERKNRGRAPGGCGEGKLALMRS